MAIKPRLKQKYKMFEMFHVRKLRALIRNIVVLKKLFGLKMDDTEELLSFKDIPMTHTTGASSASRPAVAQLNVNSPSKRNVRELLFV